MATANTEEQEISQPLLERSSGCSSCAAQRFFRWLQPVDAYSYCTHWGTDSTEDEPATAPPLPTASRLQERSPSGNVPHDEEAAHSLPAPTSSSDDLHLLNLPQATSRWRAQRALMVAWLLGSLVTLLLSSFSPFLGTTAGLAGVTGSSWYFCHCCGVKQAKDIAANVRVGLSCFLGHHACQVSLPLSSSCEACDAWKQGCAQGSR